MRGQMEQILRIGLGFQNFLIQRKFFQFVAVCLKPEMTTPSLEAERKAKADMCVRAENWAKQRAELEILGQQASGLMAFMLMAHKSQMAPKLTSSYLGLLLRFAWRSASSFAWLGLLLCLVLGLLLLCHLLGHLLGLSCNCLCFPIFSI